MSLYNGHVELFTIYFKGAIREASGMIVGK